MGMDALLLDREDLLYLSYVVPDHRQFILSE